METPPNNVAAPPPAEAQAQMPNTPALLPEVQAQTSSTLAESSMPAHPLPAQSPPELPQPPISYSDSLPSLPTIDFDNDVTVRSKFVAPSTAHGSYAESLRSVRCRILADRDGLQSVFSEDVESGTSAGTGSTGLPRPNLPTWRLCLLSLGLFFGLFLAMVDSSIVATSLLSIGRDLGSDEKVNWVALAYTLAYLSCAAVFGRVADVMGRRNAFVAASVIFFTFSIGCGFARNLHELIALRALQGVGGSGLYSLTMIIWPEITPEHQRKHIAGIIGLIIAISGVLGPVLGGLLTSYASWRWIFWINGPIGFISMLIMGFAWPNREQLPAIKLRPWTSIDFVGSMLLMLSACLITFSFQNIGSDLTKWKAPIFLGPLITGCLCGIALLLWEWLIEAKVKHIMPALPLSLFRKYVFTMAILNTMCLGFPFFAVVFTMPLRLQVVNRASGLMAGVMLLPMLGGVAVGSTAAGIMSRRMKNLRDMLIFASGIMVLGCGLESMLGDTPAFQRMALGFLPFIGLGLGMAAAATTMIVTAEAPPDGHAVAQGILAQARIFGGSMGIATSSVVLAQQEIHVVGHVVAYDSFTSKATGSQRTVDLVHKAVSQAFQRDMNICTYVSAVATAFALLAMSWRIKRLPRFFGSASPTDETVETQSPDAERSALLDEQRPISSHLGEASETEAKEEIDAREKSGHAHASEASTAQTFCEKVEDERDEPKQTKRDD